MINKPIEEFIIQSEENLRIAQAVADALPAAQRGLANSFLDRLNIHMKSSLAGWNSRRINEPFVYSWADVRYWKPEWAEQYVVALGFGDYGGRMVFGVMRDTDKTGNEPFCDELLNTIKQNFDQARTFKGWVAYVPMERPCADWSKPEVLWRLHKDEIFLNDVVGQLLDVAKISEEFVDQLVHGQGK